MKYLKLFLLILFYLSNFSLANANLENKIIVKVGSKIITEYDIKNKILSSLLLANESLNQSNINSLKAQTLESMIILQLKRIELSKFDLKNKKPEIDMFIKQISKLDSDKLQSRFKENGLDFDLFYEEVETQLKWQKLIYSFYKEKINIDENEINNEIKAFSSRQKRLDEFRISELEVLLNNDKGDKKIINDILDHIKLAGFENSVTKFSISNTSSSKGDLGWINSSSLSSNIFEIISNLKVGQVSKPIIRQNSVLFLKLIDKRIADTKDKDFEILKKNIINQKKNELFNLYSSSHLSKLKNSTYIEYKQ